jgi:hypothetical protein
MFWGSFIDGKELEFAMAIREKRIEEFLEWLGPSFIKFASSIILGDLGELVEERGDVLVLHCVVFYEARAKLA